MSDLQALTYEPGERVARITLNRPERDNGITRRLVTELEQCVERADLDPEVRVILLQSNGKGFCGGYDLVESAQGQGLMGEETVAPPPGSPLDPSVMEANHDPRETWDPMVDYAMMSRNVRAFMSLFHCGKPVVCKVHGFCVAVDRIARMPVNQLQMMKLLVNQSLYSQGLHATQLLGTVFDGITRHTGEGHTFRQRAATAGFRQAVRERDEPFGDPGPSTFKG